MIVLSCGTAMAAERGMKMVKTIEHIHWPDAPDLWMPYAPAIKVRGGTTVYLAGVTAPVYHHHPHRPEEFDAMPRDMEGQARAALEEPPARACSCRRRFSATWSPPIASSPISPIRMRSIASGLSIFAMPSRQRPPSKWCGSRPIRAVSSSSTQSLWSIERLPARRGRQRLKSQNKPLSTMLIRRQVASGK